MKQLIKNQLSPRQEILIQFIQSHSHATNKELLNHLQQYFEMISRPTIIRDLNDLIAKNLILRHSQGRGVWYEYGVRELLAWMNPENYFKVEPDQRLLKPGRLDLTQSKEWGNVFSAQEKAQLEEKTKTLQGHIQNYNGAALKKELERITIEFAWKSSHIEGNTYTLLDTERLIREHKEAPGKQHGEALMILNHKTVLEYTWTHAEDYQQVTVKQIEELHDLISKDLGIETGIRKKPVGIIGTAYLPHDNQFQIREALEQLVTLINDIKDPYTKALIALGGLAYIQPFEDGNKRTSRTLTNAILIAYNCCPLSYRSIDEIEYKKAIIILYEQHSIAYLKQLFMEQYEFAVKNYFQ